MPSLHIIKNINHVWMWGIFYKILWVPQNIVMASNNVMAVRERGLLYTNVPFNHPTLKPWKCGLVVTF